MIDMVSEDIIRSFKRLQNGDVANSMKRMGLSYGINYGVSIPQLRQLANQYKSDSELAFYLLNAEIREAKILASMLFEFEQITTDQLIAISDKVVNLELVEQFSKNMYATVDNLNILLPILIKGTLWQKLLAIYAAAWCIKIKGACRSNIIEWGIEQITNNIGDENNLIQKAIGFLLQSIAGINNEYKSQMVKMAHKMSNSEKSSVQALAQEFLWLNMA